jgi:hypothetical protein
MSHRKVPILGQDGVEGLETLHSSSFKVQRVLNNYAEESTTPRVIKFSVNGAYLAIGYESGFLEVCLVY